MNTFLDNLAIFGFSVALILVAFVIVLAVYLLIESMASRIGEWF